ncbi:MAG TPA: M20/M25/M40 family metallo-hydrolase [Rhizomicrobium sp.]|jgi:hypothetical protein
MEKAKPGLNLAIVLTLFVVAAGFWFLQIYGQARPVPAPLDASPRTFSSARAEQILARILGPEKPHPVSTEENARVRDRIVQEVRARGLHPTLYHSFACHTPHSFGLLICAGVTDIIADVRPGSGKAIILMAHYDSVPAGPGAADDESGVATVIETARALIARGLAGKHPIMAVITDGEEADLLGAAAFLRNPAFRARVGAVVNVEARGDQGPSLLFQTSPGDGALVDLYAGNTSNYATSSLYHEIYRFLPNDTDLTLFIEAGYPSFNLAYVGGVANYHTTHDTRANLDPASLQQHGDNMLGVVSGLEQANFAELRGQDDIYLDILGRWLPRVPVSWALPLAAIALLLLVAAVFLSNDSSVLAAQWLKAFAITPVLLLVAVAGGFLLYQLACLVSGMPNPANAHPIPLRIGLSIELAGAALLVSRFAPPRAAALAVWLWIAILGLVVAVFLPGFSPYFVIPSLVASLLFVLATLIPEKLDGLFGVFVFLIAALCALLIWSSIGATGEAIMGLKLHPMFTVPFAIGLSTLVPLLARYRLSRMMWAGLTAALFSGAVGFAFAQGTQPSYSSEFPQPLNFTYVQGQERAYWTADATTSLPQSLRAVLPFSPRRQRILPIMPRAYFAPANNIRLPIPNATVIARPRTGSVRSVTLLLHGAEGANQMYLDIPRAAHLNTIDLGGWHFAAPRKWADEDSVILACMSVDCRNASVTLTLASNSPVTIGLYEHRFGLPPAGHRLLAARPETAIPEQNGDGITLAGDIHIPAVR